MALTGIHVVCARVATRVGATLVLSAPEWSQTLASSGTTTNASSIDGNMLQISAGVDAFVAIGKAPVASNATGSDDGARYFLPAGATREVFCKAGDKVAWAAAS